MLFNVICALLALYAVLSPIIIIKAILIGYSLKNPSEAKIEPKIFELPKKKSRAEKEAEERAQKELDRLNILQKNIDNYNGYPMGQVEVK